MVEMNTETRIFTRRIYACCICLLIISLITGCGSTAASAGSPIFTTQASLPSQAALVTPTEPALPATQPAAVTPAAVTPQVTTAATEAASSLVWIDPALPRSLQDFFHEALNTPITTERETAGIRVEIPAMQQWTAQSGGFGGRTFWVYALAAPFPTIIDEIGASDLQAAWAGRLLKAAGSQPLLMTAETRAVLERYWGPANDAAVQITPQESLVETAWEQTAWAIIPFGQIEPRWKILRIAGQSPLARDFAPENYPLSVPVWIDGPLASSAGIADLPTNRDPNKLTVLVMTGVTALSRHIGERMESKGVTYPARDIGSLLENADLTHISNEVSFYSDCPTPGPGRLDMRFCSHPKYIELLESVGTDIVELTGNHNLDWGQQPYMDTMEMYRQRGWGVYGGGATLADAQQPLMIEHNGNRFSFQGCSLSGPANVWATNDKPGSASCDFDLLERQIQDLRGSGILPIITLQAVETDTYLPATAQGMPVFRRLARAGAVVVGGSQSHVPQTMTFIASSGSTSFVHYGLGNLFFDQMKPLAARQQFIDRHIFYEGRYLGVELITTLLEDYARPRLMTDNERAAFLEKIFALSDWSGPQP